PDFLSIDGNCADQVILFQHRHVNEGPRMPKFNRSNNSRRTLFNVSLRCRHVGNLSDLPCFCKSAKARPRNRLDYWLPLKLFGNRGRSVVKGCAAEISPPYNQRMPNLPAQIRIAFCSMTSKTGFRSPSDELIICNTSDVAVCCSKLWVSSLVR